MTEDVIKMKFDTIEESLKEIKGDIKDIKNMFEWLEEKFVTRVEFDTLKEQVKKNSDNQTKVVWILITAIIWAVLSLIFIK